MPDLPRLLGPDVHHLARCAGGCGADRRSLCHGVEGCFCARYPRNVSLESSIPAFLTASVTWDIQFRRHQQIQGGRHAKGEQRSNREAKKPQKEKIKVIAAAPSQKGAGWQPTLGSGKKK